MAANNMTTRDVDETMLLFLELRTAGKTSGEIGEIFNLSASYIRAATNRIVKADAELHDDQISFEGPQK